MRKIRLFIDKKSLKTNDLIEISEQDFHYLKKVMRVEINDEIQVFNGFDGDFKAKIAKIDKKSLEIIILDKIKEQEISNFTILAFAPVKNVGIDFIAKKATEIGVSAFLPIITSHSIIDKINISRFKANIKEACEQCEANFIPEILPIIKIDKLLESEFIKDKIIILCDESQNDKKAYEILPEIAKNRKKNQEILVLIGPEGGFSKEEFAKFYQIENLHSLSLGKRILRADTAMISALTLINQFFN